MTELTDKLRKMNKQPHSIEIILPDWIDGYCEQYAPTNSLNEKMDFVIHAAHENILRETGGPFATAIFEMASNKLISLGVNLVMTGGMSILHAEMVAIAVAQKKLGAYDLGGAETTKHEIVSSTEPCAMCFGAIPWSGVTRFVTGALSQDAREIGFDEGPKPVDWIGELTRRGIEVIDKVERNHAVSVFAQYLEKGGHIYNSREQ